MKKNRVVWFPEVRKAEIKEQDIPVPGFQEYLIKTRVSMISTGTEMTAYCGEFTPGTNWEKNFSCPFYPGYSNIGDIIAVGEGADPSLIGRRVATSCNHAEYVVVKCADPFAGEAAKGRSPLRFIPDGLNDEEAVFYTIATIVLNGIRASEAKLGDSAVVFGQGLLGQFATRFLQLSGAFPVFACDVSDYRLSLLPDAPGLIKVNTAKEDIAKVIEKHNKGRKVDCVIELTSNANLLPLEVSLLRMKGKLVILSSPKKPVSFDFEDGCAFPSVSIIGCHNYSHPAYPQHDNPWTSDRHFELFCDMLANGMLDTRKLISRIIDFREAPEAYKILDENRGSEMGIVIDWRNA